MTKASGNCRWVLASNAAMAEPQTALSCTMETSAAVPEGMPCVCRNSAHAESTRIDVASRATVCAVESGRVDGRQLCVLWAEATTGIAQDKPIMPVKTMVTTRVNRAEAL